MRPAIWAERELLMNHERKEGNDVRPVVDYNPTNTLKGRAVVAAIDAGLLPKIDGGWNDTGFIRFWELFEPVLQKEIDKEVNHAVMVFYEQRKQRANGYAEERIEKLKTAVRFLFGLFLGFLFSHFILGPLIFG